LQSFSQLNFSVLKALRRTAAIGLIQSGHAASLIIATLLTYSLHEGVVVLLASAVFCQILELAISHIWLQRAGVDIVAASVARSLRLVRANAPLGVTATVSALVLRFDVLCLSVFLPTGQVGLYAAAQWLVVAIYVVAWLFGSIVLADMSSIASDDFALKTYERRWSVRILWATVPGAAFAYWIAPLFVSRFFGQQFRDAAAISSMLLLATPFIFLNSLRLNQAIAKRNSRVYAFAYVGSVVVAAAFVLAAAKLLGTTGVAAVATLREAGIFLVLTFAARSSR
jgi:O-antigen/teichoic acid export membrane protein